MVESVGVPLEEAIAMASITPARSLGIEHQSGSLEAGKNADLIRFDEGWNLKGVWIGGRRLGRGDVG
jgi:N-acetylglucosamine-6-phosphate deacetylase